MRTALHDTQELSFPKAGIDLAMAYDRQPNRPYRKGRYARTTRVGQNVRAFEALTQRSRGGSRPGVSKYLSTQVNSEWVIQNLSLLVGTYDPPGGTMQESQSGRVVTLVAVSNGVVKVANAGDTAWTTPTNNTGDTPALNASGIIFSAVNDQKMFFADGINWVYYDPSTNTVEEWTASAGSLPEDSEDNTPRLICTWRGRTVVSGLLLDPHNWFMTKVNTPRNFDYAPDPITPTQAVAGNNSSMGLVGDVVTSLLPFSDDVLIFGCDHEIWMMRGDPMAGGSLDNISRAIGMAWGEPWCTDPYGTIYFFANRPAIYRMNVGGKIERISQPIEQLIEDVDTGNSSIRMMWNDRQQGFHVFITALDEPTATTHLFWEQRTGAWWTDTFADTDHDPLVCCVFDGNSSDDRVNLIGSWDGYVRQIDQDAEDDDGEGITSEVLLGPMIAPDLDGLMIRQMQAVLASQSGEVEYALFSGETPEIALEAYEANEPVEEGTWDSGRNFSDMVRRADYATYIRIKSTNRWAMEAIRLHLVRLGAVRERGK